jgi:hypothetical protein
MVVDHKHDPQQTPERYRQQMEAYLPARKQRTAAVLELQGLLTDHANGGT